MGKKGISSFELKAIVNELQILVRGKVSQIYHQEKREMLFQLHAPGQGKKLVKIIPGKYLCLTDTKHAPTRPTGFCMLLRKYLSNAFIKSVEQFESQRILVFELEKKDKFFLIIELFSKGNVVLTDSNYKIIGTLMWQKWKDRTVKPGERYIFPKSDINWITISKKEFFDVLVGSDKKNLATSLATQIGLGGVYAEEVCKMAKVDKGMLPGDVDSRISSKLFDALKKLIVSIEKPKGFVYENEITPVELIDDKVVETMDSYSMALDKINPFEVKSPYDKKIITLKKMIENQSLAITEQEKNIDLNTKMGELIYEKYTQLQKLLDIVSSLKKDMDWKEISVELKKEKKISSVDLKRKMVVIDL
jgi:predicted ribosome quality control (RQC) complex YloA/Tae2 family protein